MLIEWKSEYSVKIASIDDEHRKLVGFINGLHQAMMARKGKDVLGPLLDQLVLYTQEHFATEERLFQEHDYPSKRVHALEHQELVKKVVAFQKDVASGKLTVTMDVMQLLKDWLEKHILGSDMAYSNFFQRRGVK